MAKSTVLKVPDLTCGHCELSVQEALDDLDGVERAKAARARAVLGGSGDLRRPGYWAALGSGQRGGGSVLVAVTGEKEAA